MSAPAPARACAYAVVRDVFEHGARAERALQRRAAGLDTRDRALAMRLAFGAVQRRGTLDHVIERLAGRPVARIDAPLLAALRIGLYEQLYTSGAPAYAVVDDAVALAKRNARAGHGLVNAVLRRAAREGGAALLAALRDDTAEGAALAHSHPLWIARLLWDELGAEQARALMAADNEPSELALRANTLRVEPAALAESLAARTSRDATIPEALVVDGPFDVHASPQWVRGELLPQSRAAMLPARALDPQPGERVLDLCAAPGGKATHIAALMGGDGEVVAVEREPRRADALAATAGRLGAAGVRVHVADAREALDGERAFDRVLVDPPCTGLGTLQSRPDLRWRGGPQRVAEMAAVQGQILAAGARALRPGGLLVYSTCTISTTENERLIAAFADAHPDFRIEDLQEVPRVAGPLSEAAASGPFLQTLPHRDRTAGFFVARLRRS
ncbi:MAG TPA: 16S rRNA (cytosine(967)-C(5))-methyltransferase RsmB [Solirubrobacteraceae bacterium]|nr:16S rRNA (cytosine(967)-C(5))-methyltransferase RsmB [Solirubrobacteraceae bacterium]